MLHQYLLGLAWVYHYYYAGCPSWNWYYPFHYAPFAQDLVDVCSRPTFVVSFDLSRPFRPMEQLLAVLPSQSAHALPQCFRWIMTEQRSPIIDIYNGDVPIDTDGKGLPWLWIYLLPFIDEKRISEAFGLCESLMAERDRRKNEFGQELIFMHAQNLMLGQVDVAPLLQRGVGEDVGIGVSFDALVGNGVSGSLTTPRRNQIDAVRSASVVVLGFTLPPPTAHLSSILPGTRLAAPMLSATDLTPVSSYRFMYGRGPYGNGVSSGREGDSGRGGRGGRVGGGGGGGRGRGRGGTTLCKFFSSGVCREGQNCRFLHPAATNAFPMPGVVSPPAPLGKRK